MTMGERIRKAREDKGYYQAQLAELIGVKSAAVISNWEKDINKPDAEKIVRLCQVLGITASYLLDFYGNDGNSLSLKEQSHLKKYRALDERGKATVDTVLEAEYQHVQQNEVPTTYRVAARGGMREITINDQQREALRKLKEDALANGDQVDPDLF